MQGCAPFRRRISRHARGPVGSSGFGALQGWALPRMTEAWIREGRTVGGVDRCVWSILQRVLPETVRGGGGVQGCAPFRAPARQSAPVGRCVRESALMGLHMGTAVVRRVEPPLREVECLRPCGGVSPSALAEACAPVQPGCRTKVELRRAPPRGGSFRAEVYLPPGSVRGVRVAARAWRHPAARVEKSHPERWRRAPRSVQAQGINAVPSAAAIPSV